ncbi:MATE family efflux transporter [Altericroceibacterium endophyticum]|uniref:MATE family efflux transporter n=1 Tax=Altericroceibacterium endophyticum TaxID=1808508 RepID=A0A6I4T724_9SPHN|nr:MATE family efflux transporter [Altericroceibacterium endophyticum]MXO66637.1 MATE family efflux transporter [Altericroceibacterium endophyticum]
MAEKHIARLTQGSIVGHLVGQTTPAIIGIYAIVSVGLTDAYFIGRVGGDALAAVSFIFPVITALSSLGVGVMVGVASVVSRLLGAGNAEQAVRRANLGIVLAMMLGLLLGLTLFLLRQPLFRLMQADDALLPLIDDYMTPYAIGFPLLLMMNGINGVLRAQGAAKRSTTILMAYALTNLVFDPILIDGAFGWQGFGIAGASYATLLGWLVGLVTGFTLLQKSQIRFSPASLGRAHWKDGTLAIFRVATPAAFSNSINPVGLSILTAFLASEGQAAVAGFGAGGRLQTFAVVPLLALSSSIGGIVGQNWGAKRFDRARSAMLGAGSFCLLYGLAAACALYFTRGWLAERFSDDPQVIAATMRYLEISVWGYAGYGLLIVCNGALNAIDRAGTTLLLSLARVLLVMVPMAWILTASMGADAIYLAELCCNLAAGAAAMVLVAWVFGLIGHGAKGHSAN